jgi:uncharacterized protein with HEPN domain
MSKQEPLRVSEYLRHIVEAIQRIERYTSDMDELSFLNDEKTQDAVVRNLEIVGEACNNITKKHTDFATAHSAIPWGFAYEMRNALSHGYHKVDFEIVWRTAQNDLPQLLVQIEKLIQEL